jgi:NAD(P)-dependent dehydrogenase (short-subunit alcohol dehydrogenase family)
MQASIGQMKANGGGVILNMASIAGSSGLEDRFAYSMSKGAIIAMTYSVAKDYLQYKIRCNCISPARVHTPFVDRYLRRHYPGKEKDMFDEAACRRAGRHRLRPVFTGGTARGSRCPLVSTIEVILSC